MSPLRGSPQPGRVPGLRRAHRGNSRAGRRGARGRRVRRKTRLSPPPGRAPAGRTALRPQAGARCGRDGPQPSTARRRGGTGLSADLVGLARDGIRGNLREAHSASSKLKHVSKGGSERSRGPWLAISPSCGLLGEVTGDAGRPLPGEAPSLCSASTPFLALPSSPRAHLGAPASELGLFCPCLSCPWPTHTTPVQRHSDSTHPLKSALPAVRPSAGDGNSTHPAAEAEATCVPTPTSIHESSWFHLPGPASSHRPHCDLLGKRSP